MVGSLTVARALPDGNEADEMINAALKTALDLLSP
jgi:hypothetical protein